jgi:hypothetical protein
MNNFNISPEQNAPNTQENITQKNNLGLLRIEKKLITEDLQSETDPIKIAGLKEKLKNLLTKEEELDTTLSKKYSVTSDITPKETVNWAEQDPDILKRGANG